MKFSNFFLFAFFLSCAGLDREAHLGFRRDFKRGAYQEASEKLKASDIAKNKEMKLMYLMDQGMVFYQMGDFKRAVEVFQRAKAHVKSLYTISISKKAKAAVTSDYEDDYYGEDFERSYLHYYLAKSYFQLYQSGENTDFESGEKVSISSSEKRQSLYSARAEMVAWDSFFQTIQREKKFKTLYFNDIFAKLFAGMIHEAIGQSAEDQIAFKLYEDAREMYPHISPLFRDYNLEADKYGDVFFDWVQKNLKEGKQLKKQKKNRSLSKASKGLKSYIDLKYFGMLKKLRFSQFQNLKRNHKIPKTILKKLKKKKKDNVNFVLELGMIPIKDQREIDLNLNAAFNPNYSTSTKLVALASQVAVRAFAYDVLGLKPRGVLLTSHGLQVYDSYNLGGMTNIISTGPALQFKIPAVDNSPEKISATLKISKGKKLVKSLPLVLTSPLGEQSRLANKEQLGSYLLKTGGRFLVKQGLAILAAYGTYKGITGGKGENEGLGKALALAAYLGSTAAISYAEKADVRHWTSLPREIHSMSTYLAPGKYELSVNVSRGKVSGNGHSSKLGALTVTKKKGHIFSYRLNNL